MSWHHGTVIHLVGHSGSRVAKVPLPSVLSDSFFESLPRVVVYVFSVDNFVFEIIINVLDSRKLWERSVGNPGSNGFGTFPSPSNLHTSRLSDGQSALQVNPLPCTVVLRIADSKGKHAKLLRNILAGFLLAVYLSD